MLEGSDINDGQILQNTVVNTNDSGKVQYQITLPDGFVLKSDWVSQEQANRATTMWCDSVRQTIQQRVEGRRRDLSTAEGSAPSTGKSHATAPSPQGNATSSQKPGELATAMTEALRDTVDALKEEIQSLTDQLAEAEEDLKGWQVIAQTLSSSTSGKKTKRGSRGKGRKSEPQSDSVEEGPGDGETES